MLLPDWLAQRASVLPDQLALVTSEGRWTFADLDQDVRRVALALRDADIQPGARLGLLLGNTAFFVKLVHAAARLSVSLVPLNIRLTVPELSEQVRDSGCSVLISDGDRSPLAAAVQVETGIRVLNSIQVESATPLEAGGGELQHLIDLSHVHTIVYTSGTTGRAKGVRLTYSNHWWSAMGSALNLGIRSDDRLLACLPLYHVGGLSMLFRAVIYGVPVLVHQGFDAARVNEAIDRDGVTMVSVVAVMLERMLAERGHRPYPPTLRTVLVGGGPVPRALLEECEARQVPVLQTYGLTETASQAVTLSPADALRKLGSAGKPLLPMELRIVCGEHEAEPAEVGEIWLRGPSVTPSYLGQAPTPNGWLETGDLGWRDEEGYLYVVDRRDDLIISGGENVYPAEIEAVLLSHPAVEEAGVGRAAHPEWGQVPWAAVKLRAGMSPSEADLIDYCAGRLAKFKVPVRIHFVDELPRTSSGKLMRRELREN
ncbi:MAG: o-succinylbenzoate--CoA ligase [Chloroflexi bacterium]|nr:o-succinylbenzoate--CoA ligase [Chloroflexota bacterium]